ncbi:hypothetical protein N658DRAFT_525731 [Parathielavia hyrcaniae]|uniref:Uncharacterized protein n=1 Tax=Parathielavia hyrcaniae TaxID=113614 RepID=A0AAN6SZU7_9PEZI|nr:hypothetical protein N658DRAFT_525731 [Parathielavia hyrcaniae]
MLFAILSPVVLDYLVLKSSRLWGLVPQFTTTSGHIRVSADLPRLYDPSPGPTNESRERRKDSPNTMAPTPTLPQGVTRPMARQESTTTVVVATDPNPGSTSNNSLDGGAIAGIVIGSIVGILLVWWIIKSCAGPRAPDTSRQGWYDDTVPPPPRSRSRSVPHGRHHHHHHHPHRHSRRHSHSRHRSSSRPVVVEEKYATAPRRPSATDGQQHYYIQWVKCNTAVERGRYCSVEASQRVEKLRKLSTNVLSCPLHGPIAVQQFVLDSVNARPQENNPAEEEPHTQSTAEPAATARGRPPKQDSIDREPVQPPPRDIRKQRSRREIVLDSSDSESSASFPSRRRAAGRTKTSSTRELRERQRSRSTRRSHRRSVSADVVSLPPPPSLTMRHGRSEVSLPLKNGAEAQAEGQPPSTTAPQTQPTNSLEIPRPVGVMGLPSSPDMHRRASVHRSRSEGVLRQETEGQPEPAPPAPRSAVSPSGDDSPDQNPDLPFSSPNRRARRAGARSIRDRSVDTTMRRIDEHVSPEDSARNIGHARETPTPDTRSSATTSPEPQARGHAPPRHTTYHRRSGSRPRLDTLQIPPTRPQYPRDAYSAPTATPPETDISEERPARRRAKSLRHVEISPAAMKPLPPPAPMAHRNEETASLRSVRSRRFDEQGGEGRKRAAAREYMPQPPPPPGAAGRESVDSGYLSGHQAQRSWESVGPSAAADAVPKPGGKAGRNTLQKAPPQSLTPSQGQVQAQTQAQAQAQAQGRWQGQGLGETQRPVPAPLDLGAARLPPCMLPVSLLSPGAQSETDVSPVGKGGKGTLLQRMGLRRKFSGLLWDRGGQREVGVEG